MKPEVVSPDRVELVRGADAIRATHYCVARMLHGDAYLVTHEVGIAVYPRTADGLSACLRAAATLRGVVHHCRVRPLDEEVVRC